MDRPGALVKLNLPVGCLLRRAGRSGGLRRPGHGAALDCRVAGVLDGAQPSGDPGLTGGDGLAVAPAVGTVGPVGTGPLDLAGVGFALAGMRGKSEHSDARGSGVQDERDRTGPGVVAGQGGDAGPFGLGPGSGARLSCRARASASRVSARSIWSQAAPKFSWPAALTTYLGKQVRLASSQVTARHPNHEGAAALALPSDAAVLVREDIYEDRRGSPVDFTRTVWPGDTTRLVIGD